MATVQNLQITEVADGTGMFLPHVVEILRLNIIDSSPTPLTDSEIDGMIKQMNREWITGSLVMLAINGRAKVTQVGKKLRYGRRDPLDAAALVNAVLRRYDLGRDK